MCVLYEVLYVLCVCGVAPGAQLLIVDRCLCVAMLARLSVKSRLLAVMTQLSGIIALTSLTHVIYSYIHTYMHEYSTYINIRYILCIMPVCPTGVHMRDNNSIHSMTLLHTLCLHTVYKHHRLYHQG